MRIEIALTLYSLVLLGVIAMAERRPKMYRIVPDSGVDYGFRYRTRFFAQLAADRHNVRGVELYGAWQNWQVERL